jgi:hypothetical protein
MKTIKKHFVLLSWFLCQLSVIVVLVCSTLAITAPPAFAVDCRYSVNSATAECISQRLEDERQRDKERFVSQVKRLSSVRQFCSNCQLDDIDVSGANLSKAILGGSNLRNSNLSKTNLRGADLSRTILFSANLSGADLTDARLYSADLSFANLKDAKVTAEQLFGATLRNTTLPNGEVSDYPDF